MKREIKFRGKRLGNGEWIYGDLMHTTSVINGISLNHLLIGVDFEMFEMVPDTVSQFTGLYDCDKKEIYEGDVIEFTDKWEWYRSEWAARFMFARGKELTKLQEEFDALPMHRRVVEFDPEEGYNFSIYDLKEGRWRVIGNIWDDRNLVSLD